MWTDLMHKPEMLPLLWSLCLHEPLTAVEFLWYLRSDSGQSLGTMPASCPAFKDSLRPTVVRGLSNAVGQ